MPLPCNHARVQTDAVSSGAAPAIVCVFVPVLAPGPALSPVLKAARPAPAPGKGHGGARTGAEAPSPVLLLLLTRLPLPGPRRGLAPSSGAHRVVWEANPRPGCERSSAAEQGEQRPRTLVTARRGDQNPRLTVAV